MLTRSLLSPILCSTLLTLVACDKDESLGEVESETAVATASESESDSGDTDGDFGCPADAMVCPDGTAVGRSGPTCAFDPCPGDMDTDIGSESDSDSDSGSEPPPPACASQAYYEPAACPMKTEGTPYVIDPGCYTSCSPDAPTECDDASVCMVVEINPCICSDLEGVDCCGACGSADALCIPVVTGEACDAVAGNYLSLDEYECGLSPDGVEMCQWQLNLEEDGSYLWMYSDVGEGGDYACKDGVVSVGNNPNLSATYEPGIGVLTWDGIEYGKVEF